MGIFFHDKPKNVSNKEFEKVRRDLDARGLNHKEIDTVESFFAPQMVESTEKEEGIDAKEIEQSLVVLSQNEKIYHLSPEKIEMVRQVMTKYL